MDKKTANRILGETEAGYDLIASKFSDTRKRFWSELEFIKKYVKDGDRVLDFGCGNGRLLKIMQDRKIEYFGLDVSENLLAEGRKKYGDVVFSKIDPCQKTIPLEDNFFNTVYSIAVFHHFPSRKYREDVAKELFRVTKQDGHIVVTVWYLWPASRRRADVSASRGGQKKYFKNILKNWFEKIKGNSELDWNDCLVSFADNQGNKFQRFHHAFTKRELRKLFESAGFEVEKSEKIGNNLVLVAKKKSA